MPKGIKGFQKGHTTNLGRKHSEETKRKIGQAATNPSQETRNKRSKAMTGNKHLLGYKHSKKAKKKISEAQKGSKHPNWKGGQCKDSCGRILIMKYGHPFAQCRGYIRRSRLVMEKKLGRYLKAEEIVHHINSIVDDDRPKNLQLFPNQSAHTRFHRKTKKSGSE